MKSGEVVEIYKDWESLGGPPGSKYWLAFEICSIKLGGGVVVDVAPACPNVMGCCYLGTNACALTSSEPPIFGSFKVGP